MEHTPELELHLPWRRGIGNDSSRIFDARGGLVAERLAPVVGSRVVACINACKGVPIEMLKGMEGFVASVLAGYTTD